MVCFILCLRFKWLPRIKTTWNLGVRIHFRVRCESCSLTSVVTLYLHKLPCGPATSTWWSTSGMVIYQGSWLEVESRVGTNMYTAPSKIHLRHSKAACTLPCLMINCWCLLQPPPTSVETQFFRSAGWSFTWSRQKIGRAYPVWDWLDHQCGLCDLRCCTRPMFIPNIQLGIGANVASTGWLCYHKTQCLTRVSIEAIWRSKELGTVEQAGE